MKKHCIKFQFVFVLILLSPFMLLAQGDFIITDNNDTIYGKIKFKAKRIYSTGIKKIKLITPQNEKNNYWACEMAVKQFYIDTGEYRGEYINIRRKGGAHQFMPVIIKGEHLYLLFGFFKTFWLKGTSEFFYKKTDKYAVIAFFNPNFRNRISEYFKEYPELAKKIEDGQLTKDDIYKITLEYNRWKSGDSIEAGDTISHYVISPRPIQGQIDSMISTLSNINVDSSFPCMMLHPRLFSIDCGLTWQPQGKYCRNMKKYFETDSMALKEYNRFVSQRVSGYIQFGTGTAILTTMLILSEIYKYNNNT